MDAPVREITEHRVADNAVNEGLRIIAVGPVGPGGANFCYAIQPHDGASVTINFQNGPPADHGVNGVTQEALLAVIIDRLRGFQAGPFACVENQAALIHVETALAALHARTLDRVRRGVEGKVTK